MNELINCQNDSNDYNDWKEGKITEYQAHYSCGSCNENLSIQIMSDVIMAKDGCPGRRLSNIRLIYDLMLPFFPVALSVTCVRKR